MCSKSWAFGSIIEIGSSHWTKWFLNANSTSRKLKSELVKYNYGNHKLTCKKNCFQWNTTYWVHPCWQLFRSSLELGKTTARWKSHEVLLCCRLPFNYIKICDEEYSWAWSTGLSWASNFSSTIWRFTPRIDFENCCNSFSLWGWSWAKHCFCLKLSSFALWNDVVFVQHYSSFLAE